jgi:uncharacterized repeat protein (TIGR01451 family)
VGRLDGGKELNLAIGLPLRNRSELAELLRQVYDPTSSNYQRYLTTEQFSQRFGPIEKDYQSVIEFARSNHLTITATHRNRMVLDVSASVVDIEKAFRINLRLYPHPTEPRTFYAPDTDPVAPVATPILHISGLDNVLIPHPAGLSPTPTPAGTGPVPQTGSGQGPSGAYLGSDFRGAYARGVSLNGSGQMVGLLEFDGFYRADVAAYWSQAALPGVPVEIVTMDNFDGTPGSHNVEAALDIEMASSTAPGLSLIIVYEAGPNGLGDDVLNRMATDNLAKQLSSSWTFPIDPTTEQIFQQLAAQGQTFFNASGDNGAYSGPVSTPADDPYITIVGGTSLTTTGPGGAWSSEAAWNRGGAGLGAGATGGGISTTYPIPLWQRGINMNADHGSRTMRNLPDVAAVAENVWATYNNGSSLSLGGTSCSAPLWAGFNALVNQQAVSFGRAPVGFLNPALYAIGLGSSYKTCFHDIIVGNNTNGISPTEYFAVAGYDLCTGWGSPFGQNLINALALRISAIVLTNAGSAIISEGCLPPNQAIDPGETVSVNFSLKNLGSIGTTNLIAKLVSDANVLSSSRPQIYGALSGGGPAVARAFTFTAGGNCGDTITPTLELFDGSTQLGKITYNFELGKPVLALSENFDEVVAPALPSGWTTTASTGASVWVSSTAMHDTAPNAAFADESPSAGVEDLLSPLIPISTASAQLVFRNSYNTESDAVVPNSAYDGGVLEIQIGTNAFTDILSAGGTFLAGGYNQTIASSTNNDNPLAGRQAWGGNSGGFITTIVNLPRSAAGQVVQLKWRFALDSGNYYGGFGWYIDTISIKDGASCCVSTSDLAVSLSAAPEPVAPGQPLTYSFTVTNLGPDTASSVVVTNVFPANVILSTASPGCYYFPGYLLCQAGDLAAGSSTNFSLTVLPEGDGPLTNFVQVASATPDPDSSNNTGIIVSTIATNAPPIFNLQPADAVALSGSAVTFQASVFSVQPVTYQWLFNGIGIPGETGNSLVLTNVQDMQAGRYAVVASNLNGSNASALAQLTVLPPPNFQLSGISSMGGAVVVSLQSSTGLTYTLEYKISLSDTNWTQILPAMPGTGNVVSLQDTNSATTPTRFYRAIAQ